MNQITVGELIEQLTLACKQDPKITNKKIIIADDEEGNSYHGMYFTITSDPNAVKESIDFSNGIYDTDTEDPNELVILG